MNKFDQLFDSIIMEDRNTTLTYVEKKDKDGNPSELVVNVDGKLAEWVTKTVNELNSYKQAMDDYKRRSDDVKTKFKESFFEDTDNVYTRIVECNASVIKFSKVIDKDEVTVKANAKDVEKLINDIINLCDSQVADLGKAIKAAIAVADVIKEEKKKPAAERVYVNKKDKNGKLIKESITLENISNALKSAMDKVVNVFKSIIKKCSIRQDVLDDKINELDGVIE